ncbi:hypothetical protein BUALT_Bualt12G0123400 [Buddleja alternifolia]|uniref:Uncharacterized protein n=1 Tax=Buddleja alternifolia TaxID=168488 RepID=A0AAV6WVK9_9LAMI|nr:hypothetical protein BUALT_Bualt12G0123400 [Buddleja alternifolia]
MKGLLSASSNSCEIVLIRSCRGIEGKYMDYLSTLCMKKIVPVGPLVTSNDKESNTNSSEMIINWLSQKPKYSTLYISFGSENYLFKDQIQEIAKGLELTNVNFIWVIRFPIEGDQIRILEESLPLGFLDRVKDRGMVVQKWAPQAVILANPSVGGFMSHCGWSSVTKSIYFGVPVVSLPLKLDQPVNCRLVMEAGVGVEVKRDENGGFNGEGVAEAVNKVILVEGGEGFRFKVRELSEKMKMEEEEAIFEVVEELSSVCMKRNHVGQL